MNVSMIGAGAFGTAISALLADNGHDITLYTHEQNLISHINKTRENKKYLPGVRLSSHIALTSEFLEILKNELVFVAIPVPYLRAVLKNLLDRLRSARSERAQNSLQESRAQEGVVGEENTYRVIFLSKGIEQNTGLLPTEILDSILATQYPELSQKFKTYALAGPNFAQEVVQKKPMGMTLAGENLEHIAQVLRNNYLSLDLTHDKKGVQLCGALKNMLAIGVGMIGAQTNSDNSKMRFLTDGIKELKRFLIDQGGGSEAIESYAGIGDIVLSAIGSLGRNQRFGGLLGSGLSVQEALTHFNSPPEGINTLKSFMQLVHDRDQYRLFSALHDVVVTTSGVSPGFLYH